MKQYILMLAVAALPQSALLFIPVAVAIAILMFVLGTATGSTGIQQVARQQKDRRKRYERSTHRNKSRSARKAKTGDNGTGTRKNRHTENRNDPAKPRTQTIH